MNADDGLFGPGTPIGLPYGATIGSTRLVEVAVVALVIVAWLAVLAAVRFATRPRDVTPVPASADFGGDESPAVVSLFAGRWRLNEDAAESTLIDLAARGWIEFRQPSNDATHTTVHLLAPPSDPARLALYERQVLDRVRREAVDDVVPLTALTFRDPHEAQSWTSTLHASVIDEARARGLSRRRISPQLVGLLSTLAAGPAVVTGLVVFSRTLHLFGSFAAGVGVFGALTTVASRPMGERDTPAGQTAAARWLGLKQFLRNDEAFAELPPASVVVWDRYLSYGDALGVTRVCSALLDLGMGDRKRVWSAFGAGWHRVRIRYPRFWHRYGRTAPHIARRAGYALLLGGLIIHSNHGMDFASVVGWLVLLRGLYRLARLGLDLAAPRTITGEVLWLELWRSKQQGENGPTIPLVHYIAIDDTGGDRTTAWGLPSIWSEQSRPGDVVTAVVRPWTRRITQLTVNSSRAQRLTEQSAAVTQPGSAPVPMPVPAPGAVPAPLPGPVVPLPVPVTQGGVALPINAALPAATPPAAGGTRLLSADEVATALGRPVTSDGAAAQMRLGPFDLETFADPARGTPVLVLAVARGPAQQLVLRTARGGDPIQGVGDEAWAGPEWVIARRGDTVVRINLEPGTGVHPGVLNGLLARAVSRV